MLDKYQMSFNVQGLILFLLIMVPNFIWFAVSAPNDVLKNQSVTPKIDMTASVFQVILVIALCFISNKNAVPFTFGSKWIYVTLVFLVLYFLAWVVYYLGVVALPVLIALCIFPCLAFLFFAIDRQNIIAMVPIIIFTILHFLYVVFNFIKQ